MKKIAAGVVILFLVLGAVFGDGQDKEQGNASTDNFGLASTVQPAKLSEETKRILSTIGVTDIQVFDLNRIGDQAVMIRVWVEMFEKGVKQDDLINFGSENIVKEGDRGRNLKKQLIIVPNFIQKLDGEERSLSLVASLADQNGYSSSANEVHLPRHSGSRMMVPLNSEKVLLPNQPVTLITFIEEDGNSISYNESGIQKYDETGEVPEEVQIYDRAFLFRMMLEDSARE